MQMRVEAQPMEEPKRKLARLEEFIPDTANGMIYDFGRFVSVYLNPRLIPLGFVTVCESAIHDLQKGVSSVTSRPIVNGLVGHSPMIYARLRLELPNIADAIFSAGFAGAVRALVNAKHVALAAQPSR